MILSLFFVFITVCLLAYAVIPTAYDSSVTFTERQKHNYAYKLERILPKSQAKNLTKVYLIFPVILPIVFYILFPEQLRLFGVLLGFIVGFIVPNIYTRQIVQQSQMKFRDQLIDALMIMSSSFRGGLSLIQAIEAVVEEMPDPINQEFGIVLGENKMGVSLEEALNHMYHRMPSPSLQQMITAVLLARETGGNLPVIFNRIVNSIREQKKIQQNIATLTIQGKIQGLVMSVLPIAFGFIVYSTNRRLLENMLSTDIGRSILIYALISEIIGAFLIWKISSIKEY